MTVPGPKPQPRAESVALCVSELVIQGNNLDVNFRPRQRLQRRSLGYGRISPLDPPATRPNFFKEISKLSQINLSRLSHPNKCSYSVLNTRDDREFDSPSEVSKSKEFSQLFIVKILIFL